MTAMALRALTLLMVSRTQPRASIVRGLNPKGTVFMELNAHLWNEVELAKHLNLTVSCIRRWRLRKCGPEFRKLGKAVRYHPASVRAWLSSRPAGGERHAKVRGGLRTQ